MHGILRWLLDVQAIDLADPGRLSLQWLRPLDGWMWFVIAVAVILYVAAVYRRESAGFPVPRLRAAGRCGIILLGIALLCQPALVYRQDRVEPSAVAVLLDDSASMARTDLYPPAEWTALRELLEPASNGPAGQQCTRWELATAVLRRRSEEHTSELQSLRHL